MGVFLTDDDGRKVRAAAGPYLAQIFALCCSDGDAPTASQVAALAVQGAMRPLIEGCRGSDEAVRGLARATASLLGQTRDPMAIRDFLALLDEELIGLELAMSGDPGRRRATDA
ncbi:MAG: hypothetical protein P4L73_03545 [Caulobacteraceae bacterium]|nr:hypothetical protein [Caulobacteraceae bacterium]